MEFESWKSQRLPRVEREIGFCQQIFPQALTAESRTDPRQGRSLNFLLLQVHSNMGESFQLIP